MSERKRVWALIGGVALLLAAGSATIVEVAIALSLNINFALVLVTVGIVLVLLADVLYSWKSTGRLSYMLRASVGACAGFQGHIARWFRHVRAIACQVCASDMCLRRHVTRHIADLLATYIVRHHPALAAAIWAKREESAAYTDRR